MDAFQILSRAVFQQDPVECKVCWAAVLISFYSVMLDGIYLLVIYHNSILMIKINM